ncbi:cupin domain-containing protein [Sphingomonas sp. H160509]|uniref:cupin domain-containing protein n=1 Tax=Sphingomonas sp. H160509 TaxID=2955313 RepID=UPI00406CAE9C
MFAYVLEGAVRSSVNGSPVRIYRAGESWSEPPGAHHSVSANVSATKHAKLLAVFVPRTQTPRTSSYPMRPTTPTDRQHN